MIFKTILLSALFSTGLQVAAWGEGQSAASTPAAEGLSVKLETIDGHKGNLVRADRGADWAGYTVTRFAPSVYEPANPEHGLKQRDVAKVTSRFDAYLLRQFPNAGSGMGSVLEIRPVITDVKRTSTAANAISFATFQVIVSYGAASVRYELVDAGTGREVGEISSERHARPWNVSPLHLVQNFQSLGQSEEILKSDAKRLRKDLDRLGKLSGSGTGTAHGGGKSAAE